MELINLPYEIQDEIINKTSIFPSLYLMLTSKYFHDLVSENIKIRNLNVYPKFNKSSLVKFQDNYIEKLKSSNYLKNLRNKINKDKTFEMSKHN